MKKIVTLFAIIAAFSGLVAAAYAQHGVAQPANGVAIQRVITITRAELAQLVDSEKAKKIAELMEKFDRQYVTWSPICGENFNPDQASDACKLMAEQMRETGIALYGELAEYLPDVAARYEQGARSANAILKSQALLQSPAKLYEDTMNGISQGPQLGELSPGDPGSPFDVVMTDFSDPTGEMFEVLKKLVPDFGKEIPEVVRAGNTQVNMMKKAKLAQHLASQFQKAKLVLESQREYGKIIFAATKAVEAMPQILGIQYTGTLLSAKANQKVLDYYDRQRSRSKETKSQEQKLGGFEPRT